MKVGSGYRTTRVTLSLTGELPRASSVGIGMPGPVSERRPSLTVSPWAVADQGASAENIRSQPKKLQSGIAAGKSGLLSRKLPTI